MYYFLSEIFSLITIGIGIWIFLLQRRVSKLEEKSQRLQNKHKKTAITVETKNVSSLQTQEKNIQPEKRLPWEEKPLEKQSSKSVGAIHELPLQKMQKTKNLEDFFGRKFFAILGSLSIVLSIGFFISYAFAHGWIGPHGRIAIGAFTSLGILALGEFLRPKYPQFFDKLTATGIAGLMVTTYLARTYIFEGYNMPLIESSIHAFFAYVMIMGTGLILSLRYNSRFLANFSIVTGLILPLLTDGGGNIMGLLSYLCIFAFVGFVISLYKKWPEIILFLLLGTIGYTVGIYFAESEILTSYCTPDPECYTPWKNISPIMFLVFVFALYYLSASGGIIRKLFLEKFYQTNLRTINTPASPLPQGEAGRALETLELTLLITSVLLANFTAWLVFDLQEWNYLGFLVLAQGLGLFFLSEIFRKKSEKLLQEITLGGTLLAIIFATIYEIGFDHLFILTLALIAEGVLFTLANRKTKTKVFGIFSRMALAIPFFVIFEIENFYQASTAILLLIAALLFSAKEIKTHLQKVWSGLSIGLTSFHILYWSFELLTAKIPENFNFLAFVLPGIWAVALSFSVLKTKHIGSLITGLVFTGIFVFIWIFNLDLYTYTEISEENWAYQKFLLNNVLTLIIGLITIFGVLSSFFIKNLPIKISQDLQKTAVIGALSASSLGVFIFGIENISEPFRTLFFIIWAGLLLTFGYKNNWNFFRFFGIGIFLLIITKLYLYDIWDWDLGVKVLALGSLGVALLAIAFLYNKKDQK